MHSPAAFIRDCHRGGRVLWTYYINMRLGQKFMARETIIAAAESYKILEAYPDGKYFPSYLFLGRQDTETFHALFGIDVDGRNVRVVTAYYASPERVGNRSEDTSAPIT